MNASSRQRHRFRFLCLPDNVPPGGKRFAFAKQRLYQKSHKQFTVKPGLYACLVSFLKVAESQKRLQPLEHNLDLPPSSIYVQCRCRPQLLSFHGCENHYIFGCFNSFFLGFRAMFLSRPPYILSRGFGCLAAFPDRTDASLVSQVAVFYDNIPITNLRSPQSSQMFKQVKFVGFILPKRNQVPRKSDKNVPAIADDVADAGWSAVGPVANQEVFRLDVEFFEGFTTPMLVLNRNITTRQRRKFNRIMNTPRRSGWPRFLDARTIHQPHSARFTQNSARLSDNPASHQFDAHPAQPVASATKPVHDCNITDLGNSTTFKPGCRFPQRTSFGQVQHQNPQERLSIGYFPTSRQSAQLLGFTLPPIGKKRNEIIEVGGCTYLLDHLSCSMTQPAKLQARRMHGIYFNWLIRQPPYLSAYGALPHRR